MPEHLSIQADQTMKDVYVLDFLGITTPVVEAELERRITQKIKRVIMELGYGFSFVGEQYRIQLNETDYYVDLLFFHRKLKSLVALELKATKFKPEYAGKMNFYLNLLNDFVKEEGENPPIGIILCTDKDHFEVEYALRGIDKPVGVAEFRITKTLPNDLKKFLPDVKELEKEILQELSVEDQTV